MSTGRIASLSFADGSKHDFALFKESARPASPGVRYCADSGYQGIAKIHANSETPHKKPKGGELTPGQRDFNRTLSSVRIAIEHVNCWIKKFRILYQKYRNRVKNFWKPMLFACAVFNRSFVQV